MLIDKKIMKFYNDYPTTKSTYRIKNGLLSLMVSSQLSSLNKSTLWYIKVMKKLCLSYTCKNETKKCQENGIFSHASKTASLLLHIGNRVRHLFKNPPQKM